MQCPRCQIENKPGRKFCAACGQELSLACPQCAFVNDPGDRFCGGCGTALTATKLGKRKAKSTEQKKWRAESGERRAKNKEKKKARTQEPSIASRFTLHASRVSPEAERRQLTVLFCDLVGSTALSAQLDPEDWREVVRAYHQVSAEVVSRYAGYTAQHLGDGLLVYFGYPVAHEDDAQRAVRTGLEIIAALQNHPSARYEVPSPPVAQASSLHAARMAAPPEGQGEGAKEFRRLQVRIGIHTGLVVVGEIGSGEKRELLALGETPNIAARLQALAEPDTVVLSAATHRLVEGFFAFQALGAQDLKGLTQSLEVYRVLGESGVQSRFEIAITRGLTPLVGREQEVGLLLERWERAKGGAGQVVLLSGEAGIGKSRLVQVLKERLANESNARLEWRCSPFYQNSALYPVVEHLQRLLRFEKGDSPEQKLQKLEGALEQYGFVLEDTVPLLASLLSFPAERYTLPVLTPQRQKQKTLEALLTWLLKEAERQSVRLDIEDLHWADPSTLEFLSLLMDQGPTTRMLAVFTFRPEFIPPWPPHSHVTQVTLSRLARKQVEAMVERVTGGKALPAEVVQQVVAKTDGVPLFVEELTKMVVESDLLREADGHYELMGPLPSLAIPATLQDSLMARLDRLTTAREVAQLGAALGREFTYELLQAVSPVNEVNLQQALVKLVEAEVLYQRGMPPQARYFFKNALIQDAAYQSLLKSKRQQYHQQIAQVLEDRFPETKETQPELLAHHYTEAGLGAQAIPYWQRAGERAVQRAANAEAITHLTKGLELLAAFPDTPERNHQELALRTALGPVLIATKGNAAPEVEHTYARALELCRQVGETPQLFPVLFGLWLFYLARAELQTTRELGEQLLTLAQRVQDPALLLEAHRALGAALHLLGEVPLAQTYIEQGIALYDPQQYRSLAWAGAHPGVQCLWYAAWVLWHLGYPDQSLKRSHEALVLAQELSHPFSLAVALYFAAQLHQCRREGQAVQELAEEVIALCTEQGFPLWLAWGTMMRGWALAEQGQREEGIALIRQCLAALRAMGAELWQPHNLALLAEVYGKVGQAEEGLSALAEALVVVNKTGERWWETELYRLKGELTLAQSSVQSLASRVKTNQKAKARPELSRRGKGQKSKITNPQPLIPNPQAEAEACFHKAIEIARKQQAKSLELRATVSLARLWQRQGKQLAARNTLSDIYNWFTEGFDTADLKEAKALLEELSH
jgi:predicted ATPase/class 3 adenylate cyclase